MAITQWKGTPYSATATGTTTASASFPAPVSGVSTLYITDIAGSSDTAGALLQVKSGSTVIWQIQLADTAAGNLAFQEQFASPLLCAVGATASVSVTGTTVCNANIAGYYL